MPTADKYAKILKGVTQLKRTVFAVDPKTGKFKLEEKGFPDATQIAFDDSQLIPKPSYEDVFLKGSYDKFYYNGTNSALYIYGIRVDELTAYNFVATQGDAPLYNYNNKYINIIAPGNFSVMGKIVINFYETAYLYRLIMEGRKAMQEGQTLKDIRDMIEGELESTRWDFHPANTDAKKDDVRQKLRAALWGDSNQADKDVLNKIKSQANKYFDMAVIYGNPGHIDSEGNKSYQVHTITDAKIISVEQTMQIDETPIQEVYTFIARYLDKPLPKPRRGTVSADKGKGDQIRTEAMLVKAVDDISYKLGEELFDFITNPYSSYTNIYSNDEDIKRADDIMIFSGTNYTRGGGYFINANVFIPMYLTEFPNARRAALTSVTGAEPYLAPAREIVLTSMYSKSGESDYYNSVYGDAWAPNYYINPYSISDGLYILAPVNTEDDSFVGSFNAPTVNLNDQILYKNRRGITNAMTNLSDLAIFHRTYPFTDNDDMSIKANEVRGVVKNDNDSFGIFSAVVNDEDKATADELKKKLPLHPKFETISNELLKKIEKRGDKNYVKVFTYKDGVTEGNFNSKKGVIDFEFNFTTHILGDLKTEGILDDDDMTNLDTIFIALGNVQDGYVYLDELTVVNESQELVLSRDMVRMSTVPIVRASDYDGQTITFSMDFKDIFPNRTYDDVKDLLYPTGNDGPKTYSIRLRATRLYGSSGTVKAPVAMEYDGTNYGQDAKGSDLRPHPTDKGKRYDSFIPTDSVSVFVRDRFVSVSPVSQLMRINYIPRIAVFLGSYQMKYQLDQITDEMVKATIRTFQHSTAVAPDGVIPIANPKGKKKPVKGKDSIMKTDTYKNKIREGIDRGFSTKAATHMIANPKISYKVISADKTIVVTKHNDLPDKVILDKLLRYDGSSPTTVGGSLDKDNMYESGYRLYGGDDGKEANISPAKEKTRKDQFRFARETTAEDAASGETVSVSYVDPTMYGNTANGLLILGRSITQEPTADLTYMSLPNYPEGKGEMGFTPLFKFTTISSIDYFKFNTGAWFQLNNIPQYLTPGENIIPPDIEEAMKLPDVDSPEYEWFKGASPQSMDETMSALQAYDATNPVEFVSLYVGVNEILAGFKKDQLNNKIKEGDDDYLAYHYPIVKYQASITKYYEDNLDITITVNPGTKMVTSIDIKPTGSSLTLQEHIDKLNDVLIALCNAEIVDNGGTPIPGGSKFAIGDILNISTENPDKLVSSLTLRRVYDLLLNISIVNRIEEFIVEIMNDMNENMPSLEPDTDPYNDAIANGKRSVTVAVADAIEVCTARMKSEEGVKKPLKSGTDALIHSLSLDTFSEADMNINSYGIPFPGDRKVYLAHTFMTSDPGNNEENYRNVHFPVLGDMKFVPTADDNTNNGFDAAFFLSDNNQEVEEFQIQNRYIDSFDKVVEISEILDFLYFDKVNMDFPYMIGYDKPSFPRFEWNKSKYSAGYLTYSGGSFTYHTSKVSKTDNHKLVVNGDADKVIMDRGHRNPYSTMGYLTLGERNIVAVGLCRNDDYNYDNFSATKDEYGIIVTDDVGSYSIWHFVRKFTDTTDLITLRERYKNEFILSDLSIVLKDTVVGKNILEVIEESAIPSSAQTILNGADLANSSHIEVFVRTMEGTKDRLHPTAIGEEKPSLNDYRDFVYDEISKTLLGEIDESPSMLKDNGNLQDITDLSDPIERIDEMRAKGMLSTALLGIDTEAKETALNSLGTLQHDVMNAITNDSSEGELQSIVDALLAVRGDLKRYDSTRLGDFHNLLGSIQKQISICADSLTKAIFIYQAGIHPNVLPKLVDGSISVSDIPNLQYSDMYTPIVIRIDDLHNYPGMYENDYAETAKDRFDGIFNDTVFVLEPLIIDMNSAMKAVLKGFGSIHPAFKCVVTPDQNRPMTDPDYAVPKEILNYLAGISINELHRQVQFIVTPRSESARYDNYFKTAATVDDYVDNDYAYLCFNISNKNPDRLLMIADSDKPILDEFTKHLLYYYTKVKPKTNRDVIMGEMNVGNTEDESNKSYDLFIDDDDSVFDNSEFHYYQSIELLNLASEFRKTHSKLGIYSTQIDFLSEPLIYNDPSDPDSVTLGTTIYSILQHNTDGFRMNLLGSNKQLPEMSEDELNEYKMPHLYTNDLVFNNAETVKSIGGNDVPIDICLVDSTNNGKIKKALMYSLFNIGKSIGTGEDKPRALFMYEKTEDEIDTDYSPATGNEYAWVVDEIKGLPIKAVGEMGDYFTRMAFDIDVECNVET